MICATCATLRHLVVRSPLRHCATSLLLRRWCGGGGAQSLPE